MLSRISLTVVAALFLLQLSTSVVNAQGITQIQIDQPFSQQVGTGAWRIKGPFSLDNNDAQRKLGEPFVECTCTKQGANPPVTVSTNYDIDSTPGRYEFQVALAKTGQGPELWNVEVRLIIMVNGTMGPKPEQIASATKTLTVP